MKVLIEVKESVSFPNCYEFQNICIRKSDCEPVQKGLLTEEQFRELWNDNSFADALAIMKNMGLIKQSKTAKERFEEYYYKIHDHDYPNRGEFKELYDLAIKMREEAEKK